MLVATRSTGILANDIAVMRHLAKLTCIEEAIHAIGKLKNLHGIYDDALQQDILDAKAALWKAYHAEIKRQPNPMPPVEQEPTA